MFSSIDAFIETLESITNSWDEMFKALQDKALTQEQFDEYIRNTINPMINAKLDALRSSLLSALQSMYSQYEEILDAVKPIAEGNPTDLPSVIKTVKDIITWFKKAYKWLEEFMTLLPEHLSRLTSEINNVVSYSPPIHGYNLDALDIEMEPITMSDITGGN